MRDCVGLPIVYIAFWGVGGERTVPLGPTTRWSKRNGPLVQDQPEVCFLSLFASLPEGRWLAQGVSIGNDENRCVCNYLIVSNET